MTRNTTREQRMVARAWGIVLLSLVALPALAQPNAADKAAAEALFQRGKALIAAGQLEAACDKLAASQKLEPAVGTLLYLGDCYEKTGRTASAWATFEEAASLANRSNQPQREKIAVVRAAALKPQLSTLSVHVPADAELAGLVVARDGAAVPRASWGTALPVDPGPHRVDVSAPGHRPWSTTVDVPAGGQAVQVDVPALRATARDAAARSTGSPDPRPDPPAAAADDAAATAAEGTGAGRPGQPPAARPAPPGAQAGDSTGDALRVTGIIAGTVGVGGLVVGSAFGLLAKSSNDDSLEACRTETLCSPAGLALREDAQSQATVSTVGFVAGGVLLAAGVTLLLVAPSSDERAEGALSRLELAPAVAGGPAGLTVRGAW